MTTMYHFLKADMTSEYGRLRKPWTEGKKRWMRGAPIPCQRGFHASPTPFDALQYAPGPVLCIVELGADAVPHGEPVDKYASSSRHLIRAVNIDREMRLFAADCAERVLPLYESVYPNDSRVRDSIAAARAFAREEITSKQLTAAWDAAWAAARAAAAGAAARDAAKAAAWAAGAAVRAATGAASWAAAAGDAAGGAEREWQRSRFNGIAIAALER